MPSITYVIPVLNGELTLEGCLRSVLAQTAGGEIIVVDNGSIDRSVEIAQAFRVRVIHEAKQSAGFAREKGWRNSASEFVAFIDCDVEIEPTWASTLIEEMGLIDDGIQGRIVPAGLETKLNRYRKKRRARETQNTFISLVTAEGLGPFLNTAACIYRRAALERVGGFEPSLRQVEDFELSERIFQSGGGLRGTTRAAASVYYSGSRFDYLKRSFSLALWQTRLNRVRGRNVAVRHRVKQLFGAGAFHVLVQAFAIAGHLRGAVMPRLAFGTQIGSPRSRALYRNGFHLINSASLSIDDQWTLFLVGSQTRLALSRKGASALNELLEMKSVYSLDAEKLVTSLAQNGFLARREPVLQT